MRRLRVTLLAASIGLAGWMIASRQRPVALADTPHHEPAGAGAVTPADAIRKLREGNERFVNQKLTNPERDASRREEVAKGQHPFAVVLGCADSRVPPEVVFDQGLGDLFVIRVAGEVAPPEVIGSIEYAVEHLGCHTIIVLGHERCGAVEAALGVPAGSTPEGNLGQLIKDILPAIEQIDKKSPDALDAAVRANSEAVAKMIVSRSKMLGELSHKGEIEITPARYDLDTGKVEFMENAAGAGK
jgi:carbonic anhydrase